MNEENEIELYTSNWLYNAGVIGFLSCLDRDNYLTNFNDERYCISDNGSININKNIFNSINFYDNYLKDGKVVNLIGKNNYYPNFLSAAGTQNDLFRRYIISLSGNLNEGSCSLCNNGKFISNLDDDKGFNDFLCKMENYNKYHNTLLGPSEKFPNAYWNNKTNIKICHLCAFILIHHHLAFTKLSDGSEIFINSPSFKVMYELNKIVNKLFGREESSQNTRREILAMSIIEYTRRIQTTLGEWNKMNIEIVIKKYEKIYFYNLPYQTVVLISDRKIAGLLSSIGEFSILDAVLDGDEEKLLNITYSILRISIKNVANKGDKKYIDDYLKIWKNKNNLSKTAQKILDLYINIKERRSLYV